MRRVEHLPDGQKKNKGHDSPVFEAISGLKLRSHLKCYPSSVRGHLTHAAHIKAVFLHSAKTQSTHMWTNNQ